MVLVGDRNAWEGVIDGRQRIGADGLAEFLSAPHQRIAFAIKLGRRPQSAPQTRRRAALHQHRDFPKAPGLRDQQGGFARRSQAFLLSAGQLPLPTFERRHTAGYSWDKDRT